MKQFRRCQRILILSLLSLSVLAPIVFVSHKLKNLSSIGRKEFVEDLSTIKYRRDDLRLEAIQQETGEGLKEPRLIVFKDRDLNSAISSNSSGEIRDSKISGIGERTNGLESSGNGRGTNHESEAGDELFQQKETVPISREKEQFILTVKDDQSVLSQLHKVSLEKNKETLDVQNRHDRNVRPQSQRVTDEKIREMKDQLIRGKAYLSFAPPGSNSHLVKELRLRIKEVERAVGEHTKDSDLSRSALQKMRHMESSLFKASQVYPDCSSMAAKLRAMAHTAEAQVRSQKKQATYLVHLAARTTPKELHCLSMRLTSKYFTLEPNEKRLPNEQKLQNLYDPELYHYVVFSDNILASAVVVSSAVSTAVEPEKIIFHVVTDSLNFPAISMWFLLNPPGKATIQIQSTDSFDWLFNKYKATLKQNTNDPRFTIQLNHLRYYLPDIF
ncbi:probable galacturonosyltransferase 6, partial [Morus notabilis]|uniref:probable galacturonosyltransferase 6 n=1 Tax=Morus notabilis TaxID=981085 RepID=UPI000CED1B6E